MSKGNNVPAPAVRRLSLYLRQLEVFESAGRQTISSKQLGQALALSDAQVRKDLAYFGQFGHPGIGYRVPELILKLRQILGTDKGTQVILVGVGNLGRALLAFRGFPKHGFQVVAAFDKDPAKIGHPVTPTNTTDTMYVQPMSEMESVVRQGGIRLGMLTVPASAAQCAADSMIQAGIRGILNFAPVTLHVDRETAVFTVDLGMHLEQLSYKLHGADT